jgi:hypothetical protein
MMQSDGLELVKGNRAAELMKISCVIFVVVAELVSWQLVRIAFY